MRPLPIAVLCLVTISPVSSARAQMSSTEELLKGCESAVAGEETMLGGYCYGVMKGVTSMMEVFQISDDSVARTCLPGGVAVEQQARVVIKYFNEHPEELNEDHALLVMLAFTDAYPCP